MRRHQRAIDGDRDEAGLVLDDGVWVIQRDARDAAATQVDSIYSQLLDLGNKEFEGSYLFAGDKLDQPPFKEYAGGVQFVGSATVKVPKGGRKK